ncbi:hypothetical protein Tco_0389116 [Tanacetum coccineum]
MKYHPQTHIPLRSILGVLQIGIKSQDIVMSDSEDSTVTYTAVSSPFRGLSDIGSPGVDGPLVMPEDPYAYMPLPAAVSPTSDSPGYIADSGPEEDEEDPEENPINYPADGGDNDDDDDDDESSDDDEDDDDVEEDEDEEEEEHPASADSILSPIHCVTARISIRAQTPVSLSSDTKSYLSFGTPAMIRLRAETPSTSHPLPSSIPPSRTPPLLPIPLPTPSLPLLLPFTDCRAGVFEITLPPWKRLCIALGPRYKVGESSSAPTARPTRGFRADYGFVATLDDEIRPDPEREVGYGITDTWDEMLMGMPGVPPTDDTELGRRMTDFVTTVKQDTDEIYGRPDDAQDDRLLMSGWLNMLFRDRRAHAHTALLMEREARLSHEDYRVAGSRPHLTGITYVDIDTDEDTVNIGDSSLESAGTR